MKEKIIGDKTISNTKSIGVILLSFLFFFPHFSYTFLKVSSYAIGLTFFCVLFLSFKFFELKRKLISKKKFFYFILVLLFIFGHTIFIIKDSQDFGFPRFLSSLIILAIFLITSKYFGQLFLEQNDDRFKKTIKIILAVFILNSFVPFFGIRLFEANNPVGIFLEPSHYVLSIAPLLFYFTASKSKGYILILLYFLIWALFVESLVMLLVLSSCFGLILVKRSKNFLLLIPIIILLIIPNVESDYYADRLDLSKDSDNISVLFLLRGWEDAKQSLNETSGLGVGFQQLGFYKFSKTNFVAGILEAMDLGRLAKRDGGSVAPKIISEFGFFGMFFLLLFFLYYVRVFYYLLYRSYKISSDTQMFLICCVLSYIFEITIRGLGYFSLGTFLFLGALFNLEFSKKKQVTNT
jgi:hypothetical protein